MQPFDDVAERYDEDFERAFPAEHLRERIHRSFLADISAGHHILDMNCGTGTDAILLARRGIRVTAFDASASMVRQARQKVAAEGLTGLVTVEVLTFHEMSGIPTCTFDGALSNFGGLNCATDLSQVLLDVARILRNRARFVVCLLNKWSLWEILSFGLRGQVRPAMRRATRGPVAVRVGPQVVNTWYVSTGEFLQRSHQLFHLRDIMGLSVISPPPGSRDFVNRHPHLAERLLQTESRLCRLPLLRSLGDHTVFRLEKAGP